MRSKRHENEEWVEILRNGSPSKKKDTMETIITEMTIGRDVSWIFSEVVKAVFTKDLELKKLIYLYLSVEAENSPDEAVLFVNALLKDAENRDSSILRALAIRTMSSVNLPEVGEYLAEPLTRAFADPDPYVRKTAALASAKLYLVSPGICESTGIVNKLEDLLCDGNYMVIGNAVSAMLAIAKASGQPVEFTENQIESILAAMNEASEWSLVSMLEIFQYVQLREPGEAEVTATRLAAKLEHANPAVVVGTVRALLGLVGWLAPETEGAYLRRISVALASLLGAESSEIEFLAVKTAIVVAAAYPGLFTLEPRLLVPRYREAIYVKFEKLLLIQQAAAPGDADILISELKDLALSEVDPGFVRKAVETLGNLGLKHENSASTAVAALIDITNHVISSGELDDGDVLHLETGKEGRTSYTAASQAAIIAIRDLIRCYPGSFDGALMHILPAVVTLDDSNAKTAFLHILGFYGHLIENSMDVLSEMIDSFPDEQDSVQLAMLSTSVRLFLNNPTESGQALVGGLLKQATDKNSSRYSIDVKERAYFYWRLLSVGLEEAKTILCHQQFAFDGVQAATIVPEDVAQQLFVPKLGHFSSVMRRVLGKHERYAEIEEDDEDDALPPAETAVLEVVETLPMPETSATPQEAQKPEESPQAEVDDLDQLFNFG